MKKYFILAISVLVCYLCTSCASSVKVDVTRPAEMELNGANSVSVLSFKPLTSNSIYYKPSRGDRITIFDFLGLAFDYVSEDEERCLYELKSRLEKKIVNANYLTLISSSIVEKEINQGKAVSSDVYLTGQVTRFDVSDEKKEEREKINGKYFSTYYYVRNVKFDFYCEVIDSKENKILGYKNFSYSKVSDSKKTKSELPSAYELLSYSIDYAVSDLIRALQPYTERKSLKLLSHKSEEMKNADKMVKNGLITDGGRAFLKIYQETGIYEAGYNAALLLEALGKYDSAESLMEKVAKNSGEKKAYRALADIRNEKRLSEKLQNQINLKDEKKNETEEDEWYSDFDSAPVYLNFDDIDW